MSGEGIRIDDGLIEIPSDALGVGFDPDGMPKTVPAEKPAAKKEDDEVVRLKRERDDRAREAEEARRAAQEATARAQAEFTARQRAEAEAAKSQGVAVSSHMQRMYAEHATIEQGIASSKSQMSQLKDMYKRALADGDHDRVADINEQIANVASDLKDYERGKSGIEGEIERHKRAFADDKKPAAKAAPQPQPQPQGITREQFIDACPPETRPWLKAHPEFTDPNNKLHKKMMRFAEEYVEDNGDGSLNTSDFIAALDKRFGFAEKEEEIEVAADDDKGAKVEATPEPKPRAKIAAAAPVTGGGNVYSSRNPGGTHLKLPPKLAAFVKESGMDPVKYALQAHQDIREGKLPKNFLDPDYDHQF